MKTKLRFFTKATEAAANEGISPASIIYYGIGPVFDKEFMLKYGLSIKKIDRAFDLSRFGPSTKETLGVLIWTEESNKIHFTEVEKMSGMNRIAWAERLIIELQEQGHEGAISWLINYGHSDTSSRLRSHWENMKDVKLTFHIKEEAYFD